MNNEEPELTKIANLQIAHAGHKLPEQAQVAQTSIPRPFTFMSLINQWQPMGIRVVLNIPFIGNDQDFLFAIRNGPFIPRFDRRYTDFQLNGEIAPVPGSTITINSYAFNNMKNVMHCTHAWELPNPDEKKSIYITYYDYPPLLASLSQMFRKWRGTMEYRVRTVSGFSTQGYLIAGMLKNIPSYVGIYDQYKVLTSVARQDNSYREVMQNSYIMSDTSMFRHFKISVPYEYPSPWYDQFKWIGNRTRPAVLFEGSTSEENELTAVNAVYNEPHGDNFIVFGMRGALNTSVTEAQISFELEYRAGEDFQFADPGLPVGDFLQPYTNVDPNLKLVTIPDAKMTSDGIGVPTAAEAKKKPEVEIKPDDIATTTRLPQVRGFDPNLETREQYNQRLKVARERKRQPRDLTGYDVDDDYPRGSRESLGSVWSDLV